MKTIVIKREQDKIRARNAIDSLDLKKPMVVTIKEDTEIRSSKQRRLSFFLYSELGKLTGHGKDYERQRLKLAGTEILRRDSPEYENMFQLMIEPLDFSDRLLAMDFFPVTRNMSVKQGAEYLADIYNESANNGYPLPQPEDLYWAALMKEV